MDVEQTNETEKIKEGKEENKEKNEEEIGSDFLEKSLDFNQLIEVLKKQNLSIDEEKKKVFKKIHSNFIEEIENLIEQRDFELQKIKNWSESQFIGLKKTFEFEKKTTNDEFEMEKDDLQQKMYIDLKKKEIEFNQMLERKRKNNNSEISSEPNVYQEFLHQLNQQKADRTIKIEPELQEIEELLTNKKTPLTEEEIQQDISIIKKSMLIDNKSEKKHY
ncbi:brms1 [Anaeramoeba flamelloides]|uniref:Brms1 n=1 Tax=Anaeramoeba flamelloides TaxID=1746091 RepID=A0ABQ8XFY8_9EUKA|nr:brms1 [Anaeramoeba flamelloides]